MKAIVINSAGGREMLEYVERPDPVTGPGHALVEVVVAGVNFMDIATKAHADMESRKTAGKLVLVP